MRLILDKALLLFCGCALLLLQPLTAASVTSLLVAVIISSLSGILAKPWVCYAGGAGYVLLCLLQPGFCAFLPLVFYDIFLYCRPLFFVTALLPVLAASDAFSSGISRTVLNLLFIGVSYFLYKRSTTLESLHAEYLKMRDSSKEAALELESKNKDLMEKQDYEVRLATLDERNRIAREIHDNVGHMLSRSILQVGALMALNKDETVENVLNSLQQTLNQAMDSIRESVHDLHDESIDLNVQVKSLINEFKFCPVKLDYDIEGAMDKNLKYAFLSIIKEALSNVARHSGATQVTIVLREHPALFQLIIQDNGRGMTKGDESGIGLQNMADRVNAFHGNINIEGKNGFKIFISIPKGTVSK